MVFVLVTIAWIFFRVATFEDAIFIIGRIFSGPFGTPYAGSSTFTFGAMLLMLCVFIIYEIIIRKGYLNFDVRDYRPVLGWNLVAIIPMLILLGMFGISSDSFVYFKF